MGGRRTLLRNGRRIWRIAFTSATVAVLILMLIPTACLFVANVRSGLKAESNYYSDFHSS